MTKARRGLFGILIALSLIASDQIPVVAQTQTTGRIEGRVRDANARPPLDGIHRAIVTFRNQVTGFESKVQTMADGYYRINNVPPGYYTISASCPGYGSTGQTIVRDFYIHVSDFNKIKPPPLVLQKIITQARPNDRTLPSTVESTTDLISPIGRNAFDEVDPGETTAVRDAPLTEPLAAAGPDRTTTTQTPPAAAPQSQSVPGAEYEYLINTVNATRSGNFSTRQLQSLPIPGTRTFDHLAFLLPGVAPPPQTLSRTVGPGIGSGVGTSGQFAVNGLRSRANNFTVDGSDNNDEDIGVRRQGFTALLPQSIESLQEFYIATLLPPSQFGRNLGAQVNAVSQPGGGSYHGTFYLFLTDHRLNARDAFDQTGGPSKFPIRRDIDNEPVLVDDRLLEPANPVGQENEFTRLQSGFVLGGPLVREKTHFFGSFEHQEIKAEKESHFAVPTVAERGLFKSGDGEFADRRFDRVRPKFPTSAVGDAFFSLYPFPNNPGGPYGANTLTQVLPAGAGGDIFSVKLDHMLKVRGNHILTGRYNFTEDKTFLPVTGEALFSTLRAFVRTQNLSLFANSIFSQRITNELRFSYGRTRLRLNAIRYPCSTLSTALPDKPCLLQSTFIQNDPFLLNARLIENRTDGKATSQCPLRQCSPPRFQTLMADSETGSLPGLPASGTGPIGQIIVSGFSPVGVDVFHLPQSRVNNTFQIADTLFYNLLKHKFTIGFDIRRTQLNSNLDRNFRSLAVFNGAPDIVLTSSGLSNGRLCSTSGLKGCFFSGADLMAIGAPSGFHQTHARVPDSTIGLRYWQNDLFLADELRLRGNVVLTLGIRYALNTVPREVNRRIESTFSSPEVLSFQAKERELAGTSGLEQFLAGRGAIFEPDHDNFGPHVALAWDPFGDDVKKAGKMVVRAGFGIYYDQIPGAVISQSRNVFPNFLTLNLAGLGFTEGTRNFFTAFNPARLTLTHNGNRTLNTLSLDELKRAFGGRDLVESLLGLEQLTNFAGGPGFTLPAADLVTPYSQHWGLTVESELKRNFLFSLAYVGTRGVHLLRFATPNLGPNAIPVVDNLQTSSSCDSIQDDQKKRECFKRLIFSGRTFSPVCRRDFSLICQGQPLRPFPLLGSYTSIESDASSTYHSLQAQLNKAFSRGFQFTTAYTWSHAIDEVSDLFDLASGPVLPQNSFDRAAERASASFDVRHRFVNSFVWDLPFFANNRFLGNWQVAAISTFQTGQPFTILACCDTNLDGNLTDRLRTTGGIKETNRGVERFTIDGDPLNLQVNVLEDGKVKDGAVGRNTFRAPGIASVDLALSKLFRFKASHQFIVRAEAFNLFNRTHFGIPVHQLLFPNLGRSVDTRLPARTIQFAVKYGF